MPLYDYKCTQCSQIFEVQQKISEEPLKYCPNCKGLLKRLISPAGIIFKGSGFHVTDYARKPEPSKEKPELPSSKPKMELKKEEKKSEEKRADK